MPSRFPDLTFRLAKSSPFSLNLVRSHGTVTTSPFSIFILLTFAFLSDIIAASFSKSISPSLNRRRRPPPARPHPCPSTYTRFVSHGLLSSYSSRPRSSATCPRRARSSLSLPWRRGDREGKSKGRKPGSKSNGCNGQAERVGACSRRVEA